MVEHPGKILIHYIQHYGWTQKHFAFMIGKKNSEINELIKGKRNITIARDILLSHFFQTPPKFWIIKQIDYDYQQALEKKQKNPNIPLKTQPISSKISNKSMIIKIFESF